MMMYAFKMMNWASLSTQEVRKPSHLNIIRTLALGLEDNSSNWKKDLGTWRSFLDNQCAKSVYYGIIGWLCCCFALQCMKSIKKNLVIIKIPTCILLFNLSCILKALVNLVDITNYSFLKIILQYTITKYYTITIYYTIIFLLSKY